jgi:ubiquinone/menaquinone biosynthesis C-methylase UbiE
MSGSKSVWLNTWHDPVWSKVIANAVTAGLGAAATFATVTWWPRLAGFVAAEPALATALAIALGVLAGYATNSVLRSPDAQARGVLTDSKYKKVYQVTESISFYHAIANFYDHRNSAELLQTHRAVIAEIDKCLNKSPQLRVLDLGGGTGKLVAHQFFNNAQMTWTYADPCVPMVEQFKLNLGGELLHTEAHLLTIDEACQAFSSASFDVIVVSFVLSSIPQLPDFRKLARLLRANGVLVIAEADPAYSTEEPLYGFATEDGSTALKIRPIHNLELKKECEEAGLTQNFVSLVRKRGIIYSYVASFSHAAD